MTAEIISLKHPTKLYGSDNVVMDRVKINPKIAAEWLKANRHNRPLSQQHVATLAKQMEEGRWQFNAQPIIVSDTETVLDGQHRLHAVIESGAEIESVVVYGIKEEAFTTIDTGKVRNGRDVVFLSYQDVTQSQAQNVAAGARFAILFSAKSFTRKEKVSNPEILDFIATHPQLWAMAKDIESWHSQSAPLGAGLATGLYWLFAQKNKTQASAFMESLFTGEGLRRTDAAYIAREKLNADKARQVHWGLNHKIRLVVKAWNAFRKGGEASATAISPKTTDPKWITVK